MSDRTDKTQEVLAPSLLATGARAVGIIPKSFEDCYRIARVIRAAGDKRSEEVITTCIMHGLEVGLPPMQAAEVIAIINGRRCIYGDGVPALLWTHGFKIEEWFTGNRDTRVAHCRVRRPRPGAEVIERHFGVEDAKIANLLGKDGPWKSYPDRMLQMRARAFAARDGAADVLRGLHLVEEMQDITPPRDITPPKAKLDLPDSIPQEEPKAADKVSEAESDQDAPIADVEAYLTALDQSLGFAETKAEFDEVWEGHEELVEAGRISRGDNQRAVGFHDHHVVKFDKPPTEQKQAALPLDPPPTGKKGKGKDK